MSTAPEPITGPYFEMRDITDVENGDTTTSADTQTRSRRVRGSRLNKWLTEPKGSVLQMTVGGLLGLMGWGLYAGQMAIKNGECDAKIEQARTNWESEPRTRVGGAGPHGLPSSTSAIVVAPTEISDGSTRVAGAVPEGLHWTSSTASVDPAKTSAPTVTEPRKRPRRT